MPKDRSDNRVQCYVHHDDIADQAQTKRILKIRIKPSYFTPFSNNYLQRLHILILAYLYQDFQNLKIPNLIVRSKIGGLKLFY